MAADQNLFDRMDVAKQTDLSAEPLGGGFGLGEVDGIIGRDDVAQFPDKDYQARVLLAWHPLVETAGQGYDLSRADSHVGEGDVAAFVEDEDIPVYVRLAVFDVYAERYGLDLTEREVLEQELAFAPGGFGGGTTYLDVTGQPGVGRLPMVSLTGEQPASGARLAQSGGTRTGSPQGGGGGAGAAAAIYAQLLITSATFGWNQGRQARIERYGDPQFVHVDPITGHKTKIDPSELVDLTPGEAKAYVAYFAANGFPPPTISSTVEPHPYLDANGQWRMSDTNEPVHNIDRDDGAGPVPLQNPDHYYDSHGNLRWKNTNQLVADVPVRPQYRDNDGTWRWADTQEPVDTEPPSDGEGVLDDSWLDSRAETKVPSDWGSGFPNRKGVGIRWSNPSNPGDGIRIDRGNLDNSQATQRADHVIVRHNGVVIGRDGKPLPGRIADYPELAHIPLREWLEWTDWNTP